MVLLVTYAFFKKNGYKFCKKITTLSILIFILKNILRGIYSLKF